MSAKTPITLDDTDHRSAWDRIPRHLIVAGSSWMGRIVSAAAQLASVRLLLGSLGLEHYAVFALLTGLQAWFLLADLGVGVSVQNFISEARARQAPSDAVQALSRFVAVALLVATIGLLYLVTPLLAPGLLKAFPSLDIAEREQLFFVSGALSIGYGIGSIVYKIWYAEQRGYLANILPAVAALLGLSGLALASHVRPEIRLLYCLVVFVAPTAVLPLGVLAVQILRRPHLMALQTSPRLAQVLRRAIGFWFFALMAAFTLQIDFVVLSQLLSPREIATYTLMTKIFGLIFFVYNALLMALWPIFAEFISQGRWREIRGYLQRYISIGAAFIAVCTIALLWLMPVAFDMLAPGQGLRIPAGLILLTGFYQMIRVWTDTFSMLLQSMSKLRPFWVLVPIQAALSGGLQYFLAPHFGLFGIVTGLIGSFALTVTWGLPFASMRYSRAPISATS